MGCPRMWLGVSAESEKDPSVFGPDRLSEGEYRRGSGLSVVELFTWTMILIQLVVPGVCTPH